MRRGCFQEVILGTESPSRCKTDSRGEGRGEGGMEKKRTAVQRCWFAGSKRQSARLKTIGVQRASQTSGFGLHSGGTRERLQAEA